MTNCNSNRVFLTSNNYVLVPLWIQCVCCIISRPATCGNFCVKPTVHLDHLTLKMAVEFIPMIYNFLESRCCIGDEGISYITLLKNETFNIKSYVLYIGLYRIIFPIELFLLLLIPIPVLFYVCHIYVH